MKKLILLILAFVSLVSLACSMSIPSYQITKGSGHVTSETRSVSGFNSVDLASSAEVTITIGDTESVVVEADDNILPLITTEVKGSQLTIGMRPNTSINISNTIRVAITMKTLENATVSGSGSITTSDLNVDTIKLDLPGSGRITTSGTAKNLSANLAGSGSIVCDKLKAASVTADLSGSGRITVNAVESLNAKISGSGSVNYLGDPASITKTITGSGSINKLP